MSRSGSFESVVGGLKREFGECLVAVALFGSTAREEAGAESDLDFLVVLRGVPKDVERRSRVYKCIHRVVTADGVARDVTVLDLDEGFIVDGDVEITPLILNVAADAIVLYDPDEKLRVFFDRVKKIVELAGLQRYSTKDGKHGWRPKDGVLRRVEA